MILAVCADKGSPGVSWTAILLGMMWPGERVLLEADVSGGDAAFRLRAPSGRLLGRQPSLRGLSVEGRGGQVPTALLNYAHQTHLGVPVIPATDMRSEDFGLIARHWRGIAEVAQSWSGTVIADLGRLQEDNPTGPIVAASTVVLLLAKATPEGLHHLRERASALDSRLGHSAGDQRTLVVAIRCAAREHKARLRDVHELFAADPMTSNIPIAGWLAEDERTLQALRSGPLTPKLLRGDLLSSARGLAETLLERWPVPDEPIQPWHVPTTVGATNGEHLGRGMGWSQ